VLHRTEGKTDPQNFDPAAPEDTENPIYAWMPFMTRVNEGIGFQLNSPANLLITDSEGRRAGFDPSTGQVILDIPGSAYSGPGSEPQFVAVPNAIDGGYTVQANGTAEGGYHLDILSADTQGALRTVHLADSTSAGEVHNYVVHHSTADAVQTTIDGIPRISISDVSRRETDAGATPLDFAVSLSAAPSQPVTLDCVTGDGTALLSDDDYQSATGSLTFAPGGPLTQTIRVLVGGDTTEETDETFFVNLTNIVNATIDKDRAVGTILNDDTTISIGDVAQNERDAAQRSSTLPSVSRIRVSCRFRSTIRPRMARRPWRITIIRCSRAR